MDSPSAPSHQAKPSSGESLPGAKSPVAPSAPPTEDELSRINATLRSAEKRRSSVRSRLPSRSHGESAQGSQSKSRSSSWFASGSKAKVAGREASTPTVQEDEDAEAERERLEFASVRKEALQALQQKDETIAVAEGDSVREGPRESPNRKERIIVWDSAFLASRQGFS